MLDDLVREIKTLQERLREHGDFLRNEGGQREARTRTTLINPLLKVLGWDPADPGLVTLEYRTDVGWADYALKSQGNQPSAVIEAKRLGTFVDNHLGQAVGYCIQQGIAYAGVTDGNHWQLYRTFEPVALPEKCVLDIQIANTPAHEVALKMLLLWHPNLAPGQPVAANSPVLEHGNSDQSPAPLPQPPAGWVSLSKYDLPGGTPPPTAIRFPDRTETPINKWKQLPTAVANCLYDEQRLTLEMLPVLSGSVRFAANDKPITHNGQPMKYYEAVGSGEIFIDVDLSAYSSRHNSRKMLERCGVDPASVHLQVGE